MSCMGLSIRAIKSRKLEVGGGTYYDLLDLLSSKRSRSRTLYNIHNHWLNYNYHSSWARDCQLHHRGLVVKLTREGIGIGEITQEYRSSVSHHSIRLTDVIYGLTVCVLP
jgi:hypothetical protein